MNLKTGLFSFIFFFFSSTLNAQTLILSEKLKLEFDDPIFIAHSSDALIVKYESWSFMHHIVDAKSIYQKVDLSGIEELYLSSIFDETERQKLPNWLKVLSKEQADSFGVNEKNVEQKTIKDAKLLAAFDPAKSIGQVYVFEDLKIHQITVHGKKQFMTEVINNIGAR